MSKARTGIRSFLLALGVFCHASSLSATTAIEQSFSDLVRQAEVIAVGTVREIRNHWDAARQAPFTLVTFSDLTVLKGDPGGDSLTLHILGGQTPEGLTLTIAGVPRFTVGEKNVVFCAGNHRDFCPLVGIWQGVLRVTFDPQRGIETVSDNFHVPIVGVKEDKLMTLAPGMSGRTALPLSQLIQMIGQELQKSPHQR